jgi:hypothetical protein
MRNQAFDERTLKWFSVLFHRFVERNKIWTFFDHQIKSDVIDTLKSELKFLKMAFLRKKKVYLCFLIWSAVLFHGVDPAVSDPAIQEIQLKKLNGNQHFSISTLQYLSGSQPFWARGTLILKTNLAAHLSVKKKPKWWKYSYLCILSLTFKDLAAHLEKFGGTLVRHGTPVEKHCNIYWKNRSI